jgi:hypothetical protein
MSNLASSYVMVPISCALYDQVVLRSRGSISPAAILESQLETFLSQTEGDDMWDPEYLNEVAPLVDDENLQYVGNPERGYYWQLVFLPNGTQVRFSYRNTEKFAQVRHQALLYAGEEVSPSQFASKVANGTSRNAWRDLYVRRPEDKQWISAYVLRMRQRSK